MNIKFATKLFNPMENNLSPLLGTSTIATTFLRLLFGRRLDAGEHLSTTMASSLPPALARLLPATKGAANTSLNHNPTTLYQHLSRFRNDVESALVATRLLDATNV